MPSPIDRRRRSRAPCGRVGGASRWETVSRIAFANSRPSSRAARRAYPARQVAAQARQSFAARHQFLGKRGVEGGEVAHAGTPADSRPPARALPVEEVTSPRRGIDENVLGVQVGMVEAGLVDARPRRHRGRREAVTPATATRRGGRGGYCRRSTAPGKAASSKNARPLSSSPAAIQSGQATPAAPQRRQRPRLAHRQGGEAEACGGAEQPVAPKNTVFALQIGSDAADGDARDVASRVAADDQPRQRGQSLGAGQAVPLEQVAVAGLIVTKAMSPLRRLMTHGRGALSPPRCGRPTAPAAWRAAPVDDCRQDQGGQQPPRRIKGRHHHRELPGVMEPENIRQVERERSKEPQEGGEADPAT